MRIRPFIVLTSKKLGNELGFRISTASLFIQPILWLTVFLYLRSTHVSISVGSETVNYAHFLVLGIAIWRMVTYIISRLSRSLQVEGTGSRGILTAPSGEEVLFWASIISTTIIALLIGLSIVLTGILLYGFSVFLTHVGLAVFVFSLTIIVHVGIGIIFLSLAVDVRDAGSISFIVTTIFGLFSGVFFPAELFPFPMNHIAFLLPLSQGISVLRQLMLFPNGTPNWSVILLLTIETVIIFVAARIAYKRKIWKFLE